MTNKTCGCHSDTSCGGNMEGGCGKVHLRTLVDPMYDSLPDNIKEMIHSLDQQKLAVLTELKKWAEKNKHHEIVEACDHKMEKINHHMTEHC